MNEVKYDDNVIYEDIDSTSIAVKKNDCYEAVKKTTNNASTFKRSKEKSSNKMIMVVMTFAMLVLLLGAVATSTGYALFEVSKMKNDFTSELKSISQQMNTSIETLHQQVTMEVKELQNVSSLTAERVTTLDSRVCQMQEAYQNATQQIAASFSVFQRQSSQNDSALNVRIANIASQIGEIKTTLNCGGITGWRKVGNLDMTDLSQSCPSGLALKSYSPGLRSCGRASSSAGCWSTFYNTGGSQYSRVCGRVRGYQFGTAHAFNFRDIRLDGNYVTGVSLTHGSRGHRTHIWSFVTSLAEVDDGHYPGHQYCPCVSPSFPSLPFVGNDYFCESGLNSPWDTNQSIIFYPDDPLWDGQNCVSSCCEFNNPPYFIKTLPAPTSSQIELRVCNRVHSGSSDSPIDQLELYVQ